MSKARQIALERLGILFKGRDAECLEADEHLPHGAHEPSFHDPIWRYATPQSRAPFANKDIELVSYLPDNATVAQAAESSAFLVVLGAEKSPQLDFLMQARDKVLLIFEPCENRLGRFLEDVELSELTKFGVFVFAGAPYSFTPTLQDSLPPGLFRRGHPVFFISDDIRFRFDKWAEQIVEYIETLYYRHVLYPISSHSFLRFHPFRPITRELYYDQLTHGYENIPEYLSRPDVSVLKNAFIGQTAILAAAGPGLAEKLDYIRENRDRAVVICVNSAVKPLAEAGIAPHFVVINDPSMDSGKVFQHIPPMPETILVGHCLSDLGGDRFQRKYLFGEFMPGIFGERSDLDAHGSVISATFSLARLMGCARCILVGGQLSSTNPWKLDYVQGSLKKRVDLGDKPLVNRYPQLYPVKTPFGETLYTTLNFRDAALWLAENIRVSDVECINTTRQSILYGEGIDHRSTPSLAEAPIAELFDTLPTASPPLVEPSKVKPYIANETVFWRKILVDALAMLEGDDVALLDRGFTFLERCDNENVTHLVQRFDAFDNQRFHDLTFESSPKDAARGLRYCFEHVVRMSEAFLRQLSKLP